VHPRNRPSALWCAESPQDSVGDPGVWSYMRLATFPPGYFRSGKGSSLKL